MSDGFIRTVLGDRDGTDGLAYLHEHLIIDTPFIASAFPHIHLDSVESAVAEVRSCREAGVTLMVDAMPFAVGRDIERLARISQQSDVDIVAATGIHHDRYYGARHWANHLPVDTMIELLVGDLTVGADRFDYTGPVVDRLPHRAGIVKVATSGSELSIRDERALDIASGASLRTGAPVLTHCEGGLGGMHQIGRMSDAGVPTSGIVLSHVDKSADLAYLIDLAQSGAYLEFDQALRTRDEGHRSFTVVALSELVSRGHGDRLVVGTDGARRTLWRSLGGDPGLDWLARELSDLLRSVGIADDDIGRILHGNAIGALRWRAGHSVAD